PALAGRDLMIGLLEGELLDRSPTQIMLKVAGVGYLVSIPLSTFYALPEPPARVSLLIHTRIQEDALNLYGFSTQEEKDLFLQLLNIPRIGARMALNILSGINPGEFAEALAQRDIRRLSGIPGIGKKSAERIVLELKDKKIAPGAPSRPALPGEGHVQDALSALLNLGYQKNVAEKALDAVRSQGADTLEDLLRQSLKWLSK
ncbi:MAG: Holliday junction branch migration protein RuvA, partial [Desulfobaccales bacterium]